MRPSFKIDRTGQNGSADDEGQSHVNENTPLVGHLNGGNSSHNGRSFWGQVFLGKETPGLHSPNPFVRWPVHVFNILKITLLSSKCLPTQSSFLKEIDASDPTSLLTIPCSYSHYRLCQCPLDICSTWYHCRCVRMEPHACLHPQFPGHRASGRHPVLRHRRDLVQTGRDSRRLAECDIR